MASIQIMLATVSNQRMDMSLISLLSRRRKRREDASLWHRWILGTARDPRPFEAGWVPDTLEGRFQMVTLVATLALRHLRETPATDPKLPDLVYRDVFSGFDHALREEGVGDSSIARRIRKMGEAFFGLARRLDAAFSGTSTESALRQALIDNGVSPVGHEGDLAFWLIRLDETLSRLPAGVPPEVDPQEASSSASAP